MKNLFSMGPSAENNLIINFSPPKEKNAYGPDRFSFSMDPAVAVPTFAGGGQRAAVQLHRIEGSRMKSPNLRFPLQQQGQRWGHNPANVQQPMISRGEQPRGIDPHQPIRLHAA